MRREEGEGGRRVREGGGWEGGRVGEGALPVFHGAAAYFLFTPT